MESDAADFLQFKHSLKWQSADKNIRHNNRQPNQMLQNDIQQHHILHNDIHQSKTLKNDKSQNDTL
jgi:hypothetical protein